nr:helitron helicase-like domain-containing protein [Tanacetum cinerariifolium]
MRRNHANEFTNVGLNEFKKQTRNILNHVETLATFDGLDNVLGGSGPGCDVPSAVNLDVYWKYSRVSGKFPCVQQDTVACIYLNMRRNHANEFTNAGLNEFKKQTRNILNHVETLATFDGLDNVLGGSGPGCDVPSAGASLASSYSRTTRIYLDVFRNCFEFCGIKSHGECIRAFRVNLDVYWKYSWVSGKFPCVQQDTGSSPFIGGVRDSLDKRKLQPSVSSLCGSSASLPCRSSHASTNAVMITGTSYTYSDLGDCDCRCHYCEASFWYVERLKGRLHNRTPKYNLCCGGGRIQMQQSCEPPEYIKSLFENKHFMENIRAYTHMFAMTSFGAKVDESINAGFLQLYIYETDNEVQNRMDCFGGIDNSQLEPGIVEGGSRYMYAHYLDALAIFRKLGNP